MSQQHANFVLGMNNICGVIQLMWMNHSCHLLQSLEMCHVGKAQLAEIVQGDGIPGELFQIPKDDAVKELHSIRQ